MCKTPPRHRPLRDQFHVCSARGPTLVPSTTTGFQRCVWAWGDVFLQGGVHDCGRTKSLQATIDSSAHPGNWASPKVLLCMKAPCTCSRVQAFEAIMLLVLDSRSRSRQKPSAVPLEIVQRSAILCCDLLLGFLLAHWCGCVAAIALLLACRATAERPNAVVSGCW